MEEQLKRIDEIAHDILIMSRNTLLVNLRFLDMALSMFDYVPMPGTIGTDGESIYYNPIHLLKNFRIDRKYCVREYLHMVFHCLFRHMFLGTLTNERLWNLACDIAVEVAISELKLDSVTILREASETFEAASLNNHVNKLTAEKIYKYLIDKDLNEERLQKLEQTFLYDDHSYWFNKNKNSSSNENSSSNKANNNGIFDNDSSGNLLFRNCLDLIQDWKDISERMQQDLETFSKQRGDTAGNMMQNLKEINREKYDYTAFLKKFAVLTEAMKINDDEFDYIFYTYGLSLFKNMPLIEPLEYKDVKKIKEFVIAIDTSGSTSGELVQKFVQKTYNILKNEESFARRIILHIIQCDAEIQEDVKITNQEEFDSYIKNMNIKGQGGTDFRPVFEYIAKLQQDGAFTNLKGMIYFTDGYGEYPVKKPDYDVAFVFVDDEFNNPDVPPWAIKLVLKSEEI